MHLKKLMNMEKRNNKYNTYFVTFFVLCIVVILVIVCQPTRKGSGMKEFNYSEKIFFPGLDTIRRISCKGDSVLLHIDFVDDETGMPFDITKIGKNKNVAKEFLKCGIAYKHFNKEFDRLVKYTLMSGKWLVLNIRGVNTSNTATIGLSPTELQFAANKKINNSFPYNIQEDSVTFSDYILAMQVYGNRLFLPQVYNKFIKWTSISFDESNIIYTYEIDNERYVFDKAVISDVFKNVITTNIYNIYYLCSETERGIKNMYNCKIDSESFAETYSYEQLTELYMERLNSYTDSIDNR